MVDSLIQSGLAAQLYVSTLGFDRSQNYANIGVTCAEDAHGELSRIFYQGWNGGEPGGSLIGIDGADISYWHLGTIGTSWAEIANLMGCALGHWYYQGWVQSATRTINITDGASSTAPHDGHEVIPHSGYAVCAARRRGPGQSVWVPFSAGEASALTVAAARSATGVNDSYGDLGGALPPIEITIRSTG